MSFWNKLWYIVSFPIRMIFYSLIYLYKFLISPLIPHSCIYYPSCSTYMIKSIKEFGVISGTYRGIKRICRCTPFHKGGVDLVPINLKGAKKWIL